MGRDLLLSSHGFHSIQLLMNLSDGRSPFIPGFWLESVLSSLPCGPFQCLAPSKPSRENFPCYHGSGAPSPLPYSIN